MTAKKMIVVSVLGLALTGCAAQSIDQQIQQLQQKQLKISKQIYMLRKQQMEQRATSTNWVDAQNGLLPSNAFVAGNVKNQPLYVCHANYQIEGLHPGVLSDQGCVITYAGKAYTKANYQVLTTKQNLVWKPQQNMYRLSPPFVALPVMNSYFVLPQSMYNSSAVVGGYENGHPLYICRGNYQGQMHLGKTVAGFCNVAIGAKEVKLSSFEVLFYQ